MVDTKGNNINLVLEDANKQNTELYESLSTDNFMELMGNIFEAAGMEVGKYSVEKMTNDQGVEMVCCAYELTYETMKMSMTQFIIVGEKTHYTLTATEVTDIESVVDELFKSVTMK